MMTKAEQLSLEDGALVKYRGKFWNISHWINENQIVIYTTRPPGQHRTVALSDRMLSLATQADLLAARLTGDLVGLMNFNVCSFRGHSAVAPLAGILVRGKDDPALLFLSERSHPATTALQALGRRRAHLLVDWRSGCLASRQPGAPVK